MSVSPICTCVLYLAHEGYPTVPLRLAFFWISNYSADLCSAFLAAGILKLRGVHGKAGWRYLFLLEGGFTLAVGLLSFALMPPGPTQTKTWYRPKGWFTERYAGLCIQR